MLAHHYCLDSSRFSSEQYTVPSKRSNSNGRPQDLVDANNLNDAGNSLFMKCCHSEVIKVVGYTRADFSGSVEIREGYGEGRFDDVVLHTESKIRGAPHTEGDPPGSSEPVMLRLRFHEFDIPTRSGWGLAEDGKVYAYAHVPNNYHPGLWCFRDNIKP